MSAALRAILNVDHARQALDASRGGLAVVYKHSPICDRSAAALDEVGTFLESPEAAGIPVHIVDVLAARPASQWIEAATGVRHESPQALVIRDGRVAWSASHWNVTAAALGAALRTASAT